MTNPMLVDLIKAEIESYPGRTREDYETAVREHFDHLEAEAQRHVDWTDDSLDYSAEGIDRLSVTVEAFNLGGTSINYTDFRLTPEEARSMFLGIRDRYKGVIK